TINALGMFVVNTLATANYGATGLVTGTTNINNLAMSLGNSTANVFANTTTIKLANSTSTTTINPIIMTLGNSAVVMEILAGQIAFSNAAGAFGANSMIYSNASITFTDGTVQSSASVPSGTRMLFAQATVPTGWTLVTLGNDRLLRLNNSTGGSTAGTYAVSTWASLGGIGTSPAAPDNASHYHSMPNSAEWDGVVVMDTGSAFGMAFSATYNSSTYYAGGGSSHSHGQDNRVQYIDMISGSKN
ncbi:MAG TPA: hypothetical protein VEP90_28050, partial [Methylomirabilota bacterium]|nr:hypothetical protein [Methylomirabilota bacterium]